MTNIQHFFGCSTAKLTTHWERNGIYGSRSQWTGNGEHYLFQRLYVGFNNDDNIPLTIISHWAINRCYHRERAKYTCSFNGTRSACGWVSVETCRQRRSLCGCSQYDGWGGDVCRVREARWGRRTERVRVRAAATALSHNATLHVITDHSNTDGFIFREKKT